MPKSHLEDNWGDRESSVRKAVKKSLSYKSVQLKVQL
jgi:hypothetical protein